MAIETPCSANNKCNGWVRTGGYDYNEDGFAVPRVERCTEHRHHADDWFEDPGSGRDTPEGRNRRRAIDACWIDCPMKMRLLCLDEGMKDENLRHGIWGGYTEAQRQTIAEGIAARRARQPQSA